MAVNATKIQLLSTNALSLESNDPIWLGLLSLLLRISIKKVVPASKTTKKTRKTHPLVIEQKRERMR